MTIAASGINDQHYDIVEGSVVVDLLGTKGPNTGTLVHLDPGDEFSVSGNDITISGGVTPFQENNSEEAQVRVGYLSYKDTVDGKLQRITSGEDLANTIGEPVSWNPLAFGANLAMQNSGAETYVYGISEKAGSTVDHSDAIDELKLHDMYAISVLDEVPNTSSYSTHVDTMSDPTGKRERIVFVNEEFTYTGTNADDAGSIRDRNSAYQNRRLFSTHPYSGYIIETRHISTIKPEYISSVLSGEAADLNAKFISDTTVGGVRYKAGADITSSVYTNLTDND